MVSPSNSLAVVTKEATKEVTKEVTKEAIKEATKEVTTGSIVVVMVANRQDC